MAARRGAAVNGGGTAPFSASTEEVRQEQHGQFDPAVSSCRFSHFEFSRQQCLLVSISESGVVRLLDEPKAGTEVERNLETPKHCSPVAKLGYWVAMWPMGPGTNLGQPFGKC